MSVFRKIIQAEEHSDETELWMLPYSTLMLMLVILFIVFYAMSAMNSQDFETALADLASTKPGSHAAEQAKKEIALARGMREFVNKEKMADKAQVVISAQFIKMKLESPTLFDSGSAELKASGMPILEALLGQIKKMDNLVIVEGHTDNVPMHSRLYNSNWELSTARAFSVIRYFINNGIDPKRVAAHGFGENRPLFSNDTEDGKARNRRIEITIVRGEQKP